MPNDTSNDKSLTFLVTVTFRCENMLDRSELETEYGNDPMAAYKDISDNFADHPANFGDIDRSTISVTIAED